MMLTLLAPQGAGGVHALTASGVATGAPVLASPALGQVHGLTATGVASGAATLDRPALSTSGALAAVGVTAGAPGLGTPALGQRHALAAVGSITGAPQLGTPALNPPAQPAAPDGAFLPRLVRRVVALQAAPLTVSRTILGRPALSARLSDAQIAAMIAEQDRAAQWADDEEAIAALLLAA